MRAVARVARPAGGPQQRLAPGVRKVQGHPAAPRAARVRASLDSIQRGVTSDSPVLARLSAPLHLTFEFLDVAGSDCNPDSGRPAMPRAKARRSTSR